MRLRGAFWRTFRRAAFWTGVRMCFRSSWPEARGYRVIASRDTAWGSIRPRATSAAWRSSAPDRCGSHDRDTYAVSRDAGRGRYGPAVVLRETRRVRVCDGYRQVHVRNDESAGRGPKDSPSLLQD